MKTRMIFLITVLAVMFGGTSAVGLADEHAEAPEANTSFTAEATIDGETAFIKYKVCTINPAACGDEITIPVELNEDQELNHGAFVSAFAQGVETTGPGKGCLMRFVAQSDWGKPGVELGSEDLLIAAETSCAFNKKGDAEIEAEDSDDVHKPWAGIGKKKWEAQQAGATIDAGGPPPWAKKGSDD